jgi:hypothetical protein
MLIHIRSLKIIAVLLFISSIALAQSAEERLSSDITASTQKFSKSVNLYHYFNAPTENSGGTLRLHSYLNDKPNRDKWIFALLATRAGTFWDVNFNNTDYVNAGAGMYLALDPASSKEFGNSALVLTAPENSNYISVFKALPLKKETVAALVNEGFVAKNQLSPSASTLGLNAGLTRFTLKNMLKPENIKFRQLMMRIFNNNHVQFIEYEYKSYLAGFCKTSSQSAFIFIGSAPESSVTPAQANIDQSHMGQTLLYSTLPLAGLSSDEEQRTSLVTRFKEALEQIRIHGTGSAKKLISERLTDSEINELVNESYQCVRRN